MKVNVLVQKVKMRFEITYDYDLSTTLKVGLELWTIPLEHHLGTNE